MNIVWDISKKCNLNCKHCGAYEDMKKSKDYNNKEMYNIFNNIVNLADTVTLLGGEPLLYDNIEEILQKLTENHINIKIITNGQFDENMVSLIQKYNVVDIAISLEGTRVINDNIRGINTWNKAISFLDNLIQSQNSNRKLKIGVTSVINKMNAKNILDFLQFLSSKDIDYIQLSPIYLSGNAKVNKNDLEIGELELLDLYEEISVYIKENHLKNIYIDIGNAAVIGYLNIKYDLNFDTYNFECDAMLNSLYCDFYGNVYPCRKYKECFIDLKHSIDWNIEINKFSDFFIKTWDKPKCSTSCFAEAFCAKCPLESISSNLLCTEALKRIDILNLENWYVKLADSACLFSLNDRYFAVFSKNSEKIEYTKMGYDLLKFIQNSSCLIKELCKNLNLEYEIIKNHLLQEVLKKRIYLTKNK